MSLSRTVTVGAMIALAAVVTLPTAASAYVEGEYLNKFGQEEDLRSAEREKERETEAAENAQRKQEEERAAAAAQERSAREEREGREQEERSQREADEQRVAALEAHEARADECVVPALIGDSLSVAGKVLRHAHCTLGKVSRSRMYRGRLVVTGESRRAGTRLPMGTTVAVKLGRPKPRSHKSRHA